MFGALNRFIGRLDSDPSSQQSRSDSAFGFQVLRNKDPEVPLEPWFDFIVGINGRLIVSSPCLSGLLAASADTYLQDDPDPNLFATEVRNCAGSRVTFAVWSAKVAFLSLACIEFTRMANKYIRLTGSAHAHNINCRPPLQPNARPRTPISSSILHTKHLARLEHTIASEPSIQSRTTTTLRLHHRDTQRDITWRIGVG